MSPSWSRRATGVHHAGTSASDDASGRARDKVWPTEQLRTFFEATAHERLAPVWQLASTTGLRRAELVGLRWADVDLDRGMLRVAHTVTEVRGQLLQQDDARTDAAERTFALDARTVESLRRWRLRQTEERVACPAGVWIDSGRMFTRQDGSGHGPKRLSSTFTGLSIESACPVPALPGGEFR